MYPLLLEPPVKDYLWGGTRIKIDYHFKTDKEKAAEAWVLSCHKDGADTVTNGELAGRTLPEVIELWGDKALGKNAAAFPSFKKLRIQITPRGICTRSKRIFFLRDHDRICFPRSVAERTS